MTGLGELLADGLPIEESRLRLPAAIRRLVVQDPRGPGTPRPWLTVHEGPLRLTVEVTASWRQTCPSPRDPDYDPTPRVAPLDRRLIFDAPVAAGRDEDARPHRVAARGGSDSGWADVHVSG